MQIRYFLGAILWLCKARTPSPVSLNTVGSNHRQFPLLIISKLTFPASTLHPLQAVLSPLLSDFSWLFSLLSASDKCPQPQANQCTNLHIFNLFPGIPSYSPKINSCSVLPCDQCFGQ